MDRTSTDNHVDIGGGKRGFRNRDLVGGVRGTKHDAADRNAVQEELLTIQERAGMVHSAGNWGQVMQSLDRLFGGGSRNLTADTVMTADYAGFVALGAAGGDRTYTLPASNSVASRPIDFDLVRSDSSANVLTVVAAGGNLIEGAVSITIPRGGRVRLRSDGGNSWLRFGRVEPIALDNTYKFLPSSGQVAPRGLTFTAPSRGIVSGYSIWFTSAGGQPASLLNELLAEGVAAISESTQENSAVFASALVDAGQVVNVTATLTVGASGSAFSNISHRVGYRFFPEIG